MIKGEGRFSVIKENNIFLIIGYHYGENPHSQGRTICKVLREDEAIVICNLLQENERK